MKVERKVQFSEAEKGAVYMVERLLDELVNYEEIATMRHKEQTSRVISLDELYETIQDFQSLVNDSDWWEIVD